VTRGPGNTTDVFDIWKAGSTSFRIRTTPPDYHVFLAALTNGILIGEIIAYAAPTKDEAIAEGLRRLAHRGLCLPRWEPTWEPPRLNDRRQHNACHGHASRDGQLLRR